MNINEVSKKLDISKDTLRYWEKIGLLPPVKRNASGYRDYSDRDANWVYYIKALRNAGMSIERFLEFVHLYLKDIDDLDQQISHLKEEMTHLGNDYDKLAETQLKIDDLNKQSDEKISRWEYLSEYVE